MHLSEIKIENFRIFGGGDASLTVPLRPGLNVLVGENDAGKSAIIDAIRLALGTTSQDFFRIEETDFHFQSEAASQFSIRLRFSDLSVEDGGAFVEHLTYGEESPVLYVNCLATKSQGTVARRRIGVEWRSGKAGDGPALETTVRRFLEATYLRPLRDAEREMSSGKNSRLSQILQFTRELAATKNEDFDPHEFVRAVEAQEKASLPQSVANVALLADHLVGRNEGIKKAKSRLDDKYLSRLQLGTDDLSSTIGVAQAGDESQRLKRALEKLDLRLVTAAGSAVDLPHGLGYSNLLFMACELLLLGQDSDNLPLLLIEEPEAHLHPQLQLRLVEFLNEQTQATEESRPVQIILTTHSPNLASKVPLESMILLARGQGFPLAPESTQLSGPDYRFLQRFLDVTKANLFFARGVLVVEGDAEALLLPTIASLVGCDLTKHGVSIVNVGSRGLRRYSRIFRRKTPPDGGALPSIPINVACLADRDIMPDCARELLGKADTDDEDQEPGVVAQVGKEEKQRIASPRYESDLADEAARTALISNLQANDGENVRTCVADHWTLEYDLAFAGLGGLVWEAVALAKEEARQERSSKSKVPDRATVRCAAHSQYENMEKIAVESVDSEERLACQVYKPLKGKLSKAVTAQHLASLLDEQFKNNGGALAIFLPAYIRAALEFVTGAKVPHEQKKAAATEQETEVVTHLEDEPRPSGTDVD